MVNTRAATAKGSRRLKAELAKQAVTSLSDRLATIETELENLKQTIAQHHPDS
jgi:SOS response regulatory protein OraA/RecX